MAKALLAAEGEVAREEVRQHLAAVVELIEETSQIVYRPQIHELRAELARMSGDKVGRERELCEAHRLYSQMSCAGHAERLARALGH